MQQRTQTFIDALQALERDNDVEQIAALFATDAQISNPHLAEPMTGHDGARQFWQDYRGAFEQIASEFRATLEDSDVSALEWRSTGSLQPTSQPVTYAGVSMIEWSGEKIRRFSTYFDPAALRIDRGADALHLHQAHDGGRETAEQY